MYINENNNYKMLDLLLLEFCKIIKQHGDLKFYLTAHLLFAIFFHIYILLNLRAGIIEKETKINIKINTIREISLA